MSYNTCPYVYHDNLSYLTIFKPPAPFSIHSCPQRPQNSPNTQPKTQPKFTNTQPKTHPLTQPPPHKTQKHIEIRHWRSFHRCLPGRSVGETAIHHAHLALRSTAERWGSAVCGPPAGKQRSTGKKVGWGPGGWERLRWINPLGGWFSMIFPLKPQKTAIFRGKIPSSCAFFFGDFRRRTNTLGRRWSLARGEALGDSHILVTYIPICIYIYVIWLNYMGYLIYTYIIYI